MRDAYVIAGKEEAEGMLIALTDWMLNTVSTLTDEQIQDMLRSEMELNEVFADVYGLTGEKKYLDLAKRFSHRVVLNPLLEKKRPAYRYACHTQIPKVNRF